MRINHLSKIAVAGAAASLCFATAAPALAHDTGSSTDPTTTTKTPTLAEQQAWIDNWITKSQQDLTAWAAKVAADPNLTDAQKADWAAKIAAKQAALTALKSAVDAATTTDALHAAIKSAMQTDGIHGFGGWCGFFGAHHWRGHGNDPSKSQHKATTARKDEHVAPKQQQSDPGKVSRSNGQQSIVLQSKVQGQNTQGKHWDGHSTSQQHDGYQGRHSGGGSFGSGHGGFGQNGGGHHR